jgi:DNA-binding MarR family transcriptional regulator
MAGDFIASQGRPFLAHRLRRSSELIVEQVGAELLHLSLSVPPRGASMLLLVDERAPIGVVEISRRLHLSHPLIVRMARRFEILGLIRIEKDPGDARRKRLVPTDKGQAEAKAVRRLNARLTAMFGELFAEIDCDFIMMLDRLDAALDATSIGRRLSKADPEEPDEI